MIKKVLFCFFSLSFSLFADQSQEQESILASKVIITDSSGFYAMGDLSIWKVIGLSPRWRSLSEWWNGVQIVPEDFQCSINDFYVGAKLRIIPKHEYNIFDDACAANKSDLARCSHVIVNTATNKCVFAIALRPETAIVELYNESYNQGYSLGYNEGRRRINVENYHQYEKGYRDGYKQGLKDALVNGPIHN